jgi:hypothetical protein
MHWLAAILAVLTLFGVSVVLSWFASLAIARRRQKRIAAIAELFDAGTATIEGTSPIRNYFLRPSVSGLFRGRPAGFSMHGGIAGHIRISVAGHFVLRSRFAQETSVNVVCLAVA